MHRRRIITLILGGGQGRRLFPLTAYRSKPAVPIGGKYRLIDIPISNCLHSGLKNIYVLTQFNSESLNNHVNNTYRFDYFSRAFVRILAAEQTVDSTVWFQGTADAVRRNLVHLDVKGDEEVLILSGDQLYEMDYMDLIHFHRKNRADFTVSVIPVKAGEAKEFGLLRLGRGDRIVEFKEKPKTMSEISRFKYFGEGYLASMGVYVFNMKTLKKVLDGNATDFGNEVIPHSIKNFKGFGHVFNGYWKDVGTIKSFYEVNMGIAAAEPQFDFLRKGHVFTRPRFLPSAVMKKSSIEMSVIAEGSTVNDADIKRSIVGLRSVIGRKCRISRTVIMGADYFEDPESRQYPGIGIGDGTVVEGAIVDKNARIGRNVVIRNDKKLKHFDGENYYIRDGVVIILKNSRIADGTRI
jgi:glucose-1-phosphate adenylyltransferase